MNTPSVENFKKRYFCSETKIQVAALLTWALSWLAADARGATPFYAQDFEQPVGSEWSATSRSITPTKSNGFLGRLGAQTVKLALSNLPAHTNGVLEFDLYLINSWDGNAANYGPDRWGVQIDNGPVLIDTTFSNVNGENQAYPGKFGSGNYPARTGAAANNSLGFPTGQSGYGDAVYHLRLPFTNSTANLTFSFKSISGTGLVDEPWGLDNVQVFLDSYAGDGWPVIRIQPQNQSVSPGTNASFSVSASGDGALQYQWRKDGVNLVDSDKISGAHASILQLADVQYADYGLYSVEISNRLGVICSAPAALFAAARPADTLISVDFGTAASPRQSGAALLGSAGDSWNRASGSLNSIVNSANVRLPGGLLVRNFAASFVNAGAFSPMDAATAALMQDYLYGENGTQTISVGLTGLSNVVGRAFTLVIYGAGDTAGQGAALRISSGAAGGNTSLSLTNSGDSRKLSAGISVAYNIFHGTITEDALWFTASQLGTADNARFAVLNGFQLLLAEDVLAPPFISRQPSTQNVDLGGEAVFSVVVSSAGEVSYQWQYNSIDIPGATNRTLTVTNVTLANDGFYSVRASTSAGTVTSLPARLEAGMSGLKQYYFTDFEPAAGNEWSVKKLSITPAGGNRFLGQFSSQAVNLTLTNLPAHTEFTISFDLFIIRSWDGNYQFRGHGPDLWSLRVIGGPELLRTTFNNTRVPTNLPAAYDPAYVAAGQAYPGSFPGSVYPPFTGATETNTLGYLFSNNVYVNIPHDAVYHLTFTCPHSSSNLVLQFVGAPTEDLANESWGLDNVRILLDQGSVEGWPIILAQPLSQSVPEGAKVTLNVAATGSAPLAYQWFKNGTAIAGANGSALALVSSAEAWGDYSVRVSNALGSVTSQSASLRLDPGMDAPLKFNYPAIFSNGFAQFQLSGVPNHGFIILEASSDLVQWSPIITNAAAAVPLNYSIPLTNQSKLFFRARP